MKLVNMGISTVLAIAIGLPEGLATFAPALNV